jgi:glycosyltransferase involved in cell wall biosynthesis
LATALRILPVHKVRYLGNGIDIDAFEQAHGEADRDAMRQELGLASEDLAILVVARFEPPKGHAFFLEGFRQLVEQLPRARAVFAGLGYDEERIRALVREYGLEDQVRFIGYRRDVPAVLRAADVFALTSVKEGLPRSVVEAMLAGVPVVVSDVPGNRDVVQQGRTGLLVPFGDVSALCAALYRATTDQAFRRHVTAAAAARVRAVHDEAAIVKSLASSYHELLARRDQNFRATGRGPWRRSNRRGFEGSH